MIVNLEQDGDDLILPFPEEMLDELGWKGGDVLEWIENEDNSLTLRKVL
jgi:bifunctional DNA-binding transcriptional regulator/antitoxin component of YhaV-PrlF toxin-antitoxin module